MNKILCNVTDVKLNIQDRGILILDVFVEIVDGGCLSVFNMCLDTYDESKKKRVGTSYGCEMIRQTLQFFGVNNFDDIKNYKCYLLTDKENIYSASDVIGIEQLPFSQYKRNLSCIIKAEVLSEFRDTK